MSDSHEGCRDVRRDEAVRAGSPKALVWPRTGCRDVRRDEAVRAAEDAAAVPAIQHRDLPEVVAALTERVARLEAAQATLGSGDEIARLTAERDAAIRERDAAVDDGERLRMSLTACDVIANSNTPQSLSCNRIIHPNYDCAAVQSAIRAVEQQIALRDRVSELERERDAAIRERDAALSAAGITHGVFPELYELRAERERLRGRVAELERAYSAECDARAQAHRELSDLAAAVRERESGEECDHSYAAQCREAAAARDRADRMMPAPAANAGGEHEPAAWAELLGRLAEWDHMTTAADGPYWIGEIKKVLSGAAAPLEAAGGDDAVVVPQTVVAGNFAQIHWNTCCRLHRMAMDKAGVRWTQSTEPSRPESEEAGNAGGEQEPPRGWLTAEERDAADHAADILEEMEDDDGNALKPKADVLRAMLARETPPMVKVPSRHVIITTVDARERIDRQWIAAIRAAGGEVEG